MRLIFARCRMAKDDEGAEQHTVLHSGDLLVVETWIHNLPLERKALVIPSINLTSLMTC